MLDSLTCIPSLDIDYRDWIVKSVFILQETDVPILPVAFWLLPSSEISSHISFDSIEAYPPNWWDSKTLTMQPQRIPDIGTQKIGALYVNCSKFDIILIFGVTWGQVPWCTVIKPQPEEFMKRVIDNQNGLRLKREFTEFKLKGYVKQFKGIWHCKETGVYISGETVPVFGRETHVLRFGLSSEVK